MDHPDPRSLEARLDEAGGMRRLARSLLRDASLADDVMQEASLAALRRAGERGPPPVAWWSAVVRNVALKLVRGRHRRYERERAAARPEAQPGADTVARRMALHRAVVTAVETLPEPYREVVIRRWFDGEKPQRIASELGVPIATVKTRMRRAIAQLRETLRREWGDGVAGLLMALARPRAAAFAAAPAAAGVLVMGAKLKVAVAAAILVAVGAWTVRELWPGSGSPHAKAPVTETAPVAIADASEKQAELAEASRVEQPIAHESASTPPEDPRRLGRITGVVLGPSGPFPGARVELERRIGEDAVPHPSLRALLPERRRATTSAADGTFEFQEVERGVAFAIKASAEPDLFGSTPDGIRAGQHALVTIAAFARLTGVVRRARGAPVSGATVVASTVGGADVAIERQAKTDPAGRFEMARMPAWPVNLQTFTPAGDLMAPVRAELHSGESTDVELVLSDEFGLEGVVRDDRDGHPIPDATIHLGNGEGQGAPIAVTDEAGTFRIQTELRWPEGRLLFVRADGYGFHEFNAPSPRDPAASVEVRLHRGRAIRGRVVTADGAPLPDAVATVNFSIDPVRMNLGEDYAASRTGTDGRFVLADLDPRMDHVLLVRSERFAGTFVAVRGSPTREEDVDVGDVVARRGALIAGTLVDGEKRPVPCRHVSLERIDSSTARDPVERERFEFTRAVVGRSEFTSADGGFAFDGVTPGDWRLQADGGVPLGNPPVSLTIRGDEIHDGIELSIDEGLTITGRVVDDRGAPVAAAKILARGDGEAPPPLLRITVSQVAHPEPDGTFVIRGLPPGRFRVIVEFQGSQRKRSRRLAAAIADEVRAGQTDVTLVMHDGALICGRVTTPDGEPAGRASVKALDAGQRFLGESQCDEDGRFDLVVPELEDPGAAGSAVQRRSVTLTVEGAPRDAFRDATPIGVATVEHAELNGPEITIQLAPSGR